MQNKILVMFANQYEVDGSKGCTVNFYMLNAVGRMDFETSVSGSIGQQCAKVSLPYEYREKIQHVPGIYDGTFEMTTGSDRKPFLKLVDLVEVPDSHARDAFDIGGPVKK